MIRALLLTLLLTFAYVPSADAGWGFWERVKERIEQRRAKRAERRAARRQARAVPELDPSAAGAALILVSGGAYLILNRRRREA